MACRNDDADSVTAFDALYTNNQIQKMKVLLPYIEPSMQKHLAIYIKYMELQYTIKYTKEHPFRICSQNVQPPDLGKLCQELSLYSSPEEVRQLKQLENMVQTFHTVQEMSQTFEAMKEIFPDMADSFDFGAASDSKAGSGSPDTSGDDSNRSGIPSSVMDIMMNMLTPEQKAMYEMFQKEGEDNDN
jgi:hypothetical protein